MCLYHFQKLFALQKVENLRSVDNFSFGEERLELAVVESLPIAYCLKEDGGYKFLYGVLCNELRVYR